MKTIQQRAREYAEAIAASHVSSQFQSSAARKYASYLYYERETWQAYIQGATETIDELKTVLSVSEDKYLRENINKMIKFLEGEE
jgi:hypothetical protein